MDIFPGKSYPLGATVQPDGVNFCLFSRNSTAVELLLFNRAEDAVPSRVIRLDSEQHRTFSYWHVLVRGITPGQLYGYRVYGPFEPQEGLRFDGSKVLIDPYARAVMYGDNYRREEATRPGDNCAHAMKSVVVDLSTYDWEGDKPIRKRRFNDAVIYEMHVGGFTRHPNSGIAPERRGTYAALIDKIPYLQELGVTAVELMPVQQFDHQAAPSNLINYWGYQPIAFFAPHRGYSSRTDPLGPVDEFRDMVKALHRAGIEVILDVVFNHTAEDDQNGPTLSFRGIENRAYYMLESSDQSRYKNYSGTGNTINSNNSIVRRMIIDCLHHWVEYMHVDGFRFDLASVMSRGEDGHPLTNPPILWDIDSDPILAGVQIIAEAWDAGGLYQVGSFIGDRWAEWNGRYRDNVRRFVKGDQGMVGALAAAMVGSRDIYHQPDRDPNRSINFITAHDGFTLNDLVSYNDKHNEANGENNRDGDNHNNSWNCGHEGPTGDPNIEALRTRQIRNFLAILLVSQGTPMLVMGDEIRRSQMGNNNAYAQDNELSWFNWEDVHRQHNLLRFVQLLIRFHKQYHVFRDQRFWTVPGGPEIIWHGVRLNTPDWEYHSHTLAFELLHPANGEHLYVMINAFTDILCYELPRLHSGECWCRVVDTALPPPYDFSDPPYSLPHDIHEYGVHGRSVVILSAH
jgi:glycogen operon protein